MFADKLSISTAAETIAGADCYTCLRSTDHDNKEEAENARQNARSYCSFPGLSHGSSRSISRLRLWHRFRFWIVRIRNQQRSCRGLWSRWHRNVTRRQQPYDRQRGWECEQYRIHQRSLQDHTDTARLGRYSGVELRQRGNPTASMLSDFGLGRAYVPASP